MISKSFLVRLFKLLIIQSKQLHLSTHYDMKFKVFDCNSSLLSIVFVFSLTPIDGTLKKAQQVIRKLASFNHWWLIWKIKICWMQIGWICFYVNIESIQYIWYWRCFSQIYCLWIEYKIIMKTHMLESRIKRLKTFL